MPLPVADSWYARTNFAQGVTRILEPHVDRLEQANIWHVKGRDRDLLIDSGMGIVPLRASFPDLFSEAREIVAVATHTHMDHIGATHEFAHRWVHAAEADDMANPSGSFISLVCADFDPAMKEAFVRAGYAPLGEYLIDALPYGGYDPRSYRLKGAAPTRLLGDGDVVDLGDRQFEVIHVPGHSPGSIALWEAATGLLFTGDLVYDGPLIYEGPDMDLETYARSIRKLMKLPIKTVHAGHDPSFGKARLEAIAADYFARWGIAAWLPRPIFSLVP
jgi:glyoxylase-like metal-dependent hydrolase (beta-lactamase superfamily II)